MGEGLILGFILLLEGWIITGVKHHYFRSGESMSLCLSVVSIMFFLVATLCFIWALLRGV